MKAWDLWVGCGAHRLAALSASFVGEVHTPNVDATAIPWCTGKPLRYFALRRPKWEPSETHVGGHADARERGRPGAGLEKFARG